MPTYIQGLPSYAGTFNIYTQICHTNTFARRTERLSFRLLRWLQFVRIKSQPVFCSQSKIAKYNEDTFRYCLLTIHFTKSQTAARSMWVAPVAQNKFPNTRPPNGYWSSFPEVKRTERDIDDSSSSSAAVYTSWIYVSSPTPRLHVSKGKGKGNPVTGPGEPIA
jgi:hypothetical protein